MRHDEAWTRLPDLLDDRDDAELLAHVRACADCQRQLFLLGRVDRILRHTAGTSARHARIRLRPRLARRPPRWASRRQCLSPCSSSSTAADSR